ncbi:MAG: hyaluronidase [Verrucomicrobiales bacterium]|nr:hyaluronidase [Verrucomicrobiales bacterium]
MQNLGIIEGFFGRQWSWPARADYAAFLKQHGYNYYIYAPKGDRFLREEWHKPLPDVTLTGLRKIREIYWKAGVAFGIGINLYELHFQYDDKAIQLLENKIRQLNELSPDILAILFDDMKGDLDRIAEIQVDATHRAAAATTAGKVIMCPTYYSDDPKLDQIFGQRPANYLESLGKSLDSSVNVFWTGPEVCSFAYPIDHLKSVAERLGRKPFLWDNYPVNDSAKMCKHLHLRPFVGRPYQIALHTAGHAVNPMNQPYLSQIPLATLAERYREKETYDPDKAFQNAVTALCPEPLAAALQEDLPLLHDRGLDQISESEKAQLIARYQTFNTPQANEIVEWLNGKYPHAMECLTD